MKPAKDDSRLSYVRLDDAPEAEGTRHRPLSSAEQVWTLGILACLTSIVFLVAIVAVLFNFDGKPMPDWPHGITLNTLVSVLSTVMKATMAFVLTESLAQLKWSWFRGGNKLSDLALLDAASRGAMGALIVLTRFLPRHLVTFGRFILVLAAACDPFVQQVIGINTRSIHDAGRSSIQVCNASLYTDYGEGAGPGMNEVPLSTNGAIYSGLFQTQAPNSNDILASCPTGNCTFPTYQSLGFCSQCANITNSLHLNKTSLGSTLSTYNYQLPNGLSFTTAENMMYMMNATYNIDILKLNTSGVPLILNFTAITSPGYGVPPAVQISATECALYFCVTTHKAKVTEGVFSETRTAISTSSNTSTSWTDTTKDFAITPETCFFNGSHYEQPYENPQDYVYNVNWLSRLAM
ncbi:uncharacterized protein N7477_008777 [Penicillium maclennaniae]|uniref:uncharacterized protein n=1 Tax=Penicillium maclennaniae TaxID=1343394 RepID=UPI00253FB63B|nr:uncharacterized protein N7477_008777 [Penicillium maclennaniae]KAJ5666329.1 hypothetical protein N7477_008777 [Penicillium maclennaniae]